MERINLMLIIIFVFIAAIFLVFTIPKEPALYKVGNLTICDKYHDKTECKRG